MKAISKALAGGVVAMGALVAVSADAERTKEVCDAKTVPSYIEGQKADVRKACYDPRKNMPEIPAEVKMTARVTYDAKGIVDSVSIVQGFNPLLGPCVAGKLRTWHPPCGPGTFDVDFDWKK